MNFPCYGCQKREIGCHAKCDQYQEARAEADKALDAKHEYIDGWVYYKSVITKNINKTIKRKLRQ